MLRGKCYHTIEPKKAIIPTTLLHNKKIYNIFWCHWAYKIKKYFVVVNNKTDNILKDIIIFRAFHPNAYGGEEEGTIEIGNPTKYSKMCIDNYFINNFKFIENKKPGKKIINRWMIETHFLGFWTLDNPHHWPRKEFVKVPGYHGLL